MTRRRCWGTVRGWRRWQGRCWGGDGAWLQQLTAQEVINFLSFFIITFFFVVGWKAHGAMSRNDLRSPTEDERTTQTWMMEGLE